MGAGPGGQVLPGGSIHIGLQVLSEATGYTCPPIYSAHRLF